MSNLLRVAVFGAGALGKEHARIYAELDAAGLARFVGIYDVNAQAAQRVAEKHGTKVFGSAAEAADQSDAVSVVTPTNTHFDLALSLLQARKHCLIEKPMTNNAAQAAELVQM